MLEHPEIGWIERTGYPSWMQPKEIQCERCGEFIVDEVYEDDLHDCLCLDCLLKLHLKEG